MRHVTLLTKRKKQELDRSVADPAIMDANDGNKKIYDY